jgi:hypothetical protein
MWRQQDIVRLFSMEDKWIVRNGDKTGQSGIPLKIKIFIKKKTEKNHTWESNI